MGSKPTEVEKGFGTRGGAGIDLRARSREGYRAGAAGATMPDSTFE